MTFTLENTKDATHIKFYDTLSPQMFIEEGEGYSFLNDESSGWAEQPNGRSIGSDAIELSRQHNETREHWTNFGVTQYAQQQKEEVNFSGNEHHIALQVEALGDVPDFYADEPLADGETVEVSYGEIKDDYPELIYKPMGDVNIKSMQIGPLVTTESHEESVNIHFVETPIFTQAMADAGELPPVDMPVQMRRAYGNDNEFYNGKLKHLSGYNLWFCDDKYGDELHPRAHVEFKPIQTDEEKLRSKLWDIVSEEVNSDSMTNVILHELINSDEFTITLKG